MKLGEWMQLAVNVLTALGLGAGGFLAARRWLARRFERWVAGVAADSREAAEQLRTSNGTTVAQYVEQMNGKLSDVNTLAQNNAIRIEAVAARSDALAQENSRRLDEHILRGHVS